MSESFREEIAKLEALYAGDPGGRVFTHLAEACRKAGDLDRARDILDRGLRHHDDYASAYVVLGRVLMDMDQSDEARATFRRVVELDRHNLIALRSLGDLAAAAGDTQEALRHYRALMRLDPADERLQATVARLESSGPAPESAEPVPSSEDGGPAVDGTAEVPGTGDDAIAPSGEMVTETMAELYAVQGLHVRAAEVYRSLLRASPGDDRVKERLRQLESLTHNTDEGAVSAAVPAAVEYPGAGSADDTPGWLERVESAWTGGSGVAGARPTPYAWTETAHTVRAEDDGEDRPISAYFESLLAWRPDQRRSDTPLDGGTPEPVDDDGTVEEDEDLDMFRSWLQSLKK